MDVDTAKEMSQLFVEAIVAPAFSDEAFDILSQKPSIRLLELPDFKAKESSYLLKYVQGGALLQSPDNVVIDDNQMTVATTHRPEPQAIRDLNIAFAVCKHVKSNAIVLVKNGQTVGVGAGQMSRVEAVDIALKKAGDLAKGAVCGSDAFFPFKDSVERLADHGVIGVIHPGGSKRDQESIDVCNERNMVMLVTGIRHFKH